MKTILSSNEENQKSSGKWTYELIGLICVILYIKTIKSKITNKLLNLLKYVNF